MIYRQVAGMLKPVLDISVPALAFLMMLVVGTLPEVMPYFEPFADSRWSAKGYGHSTKDGPECWDGETWARLYPWGHVHHYAAVGQFCPRARLREERHPGRRHALHQSARVR